MATARMTQRPRQTALLVSALILASVSGAAGQADDPSTRQATARQIRHAVAELQALQQRIRRERTDHQQAMRQLDQQIDRLEGDVERLRGEVAALQRDAEQQRATLAEHEQAASEADRRRAAAVERTTTLIQTLAQRARIGVPSIRDLADRMMQHASDLRRAESPADQAGAVESAHDFLGDYLQSHRKRSITNRRLNLPQPGVARHAYVARLGSIAEVYLTEDGRVAGAAARSPERRWRAPLDQPRHGQVRGVIGVLREKRPPRLLNVPLALPNPEAGTP